MARGSLEEVAAAEERLRAKDFAACTDEELAEMVSRFAAAVHRVARDVEPELAGSPSTTTTGADR